MKPSRPESSTPKHREAGNARRIRYRIADISELQTLLALRTRSAHAQCLSHHPLETLSVWLSAPPSEPILHAIRRGHAIVGEDDRQIIGYVIVDIEAQKLDSLYVAPEYFRHGQGAALLARAETLARQHDIETLKLSSSLNAIDFYRAQGYVLLEIDDYPNASGVTVKRGVMEKMLRPPSF